MNNLFLGVDTSNYTTSLCISDGKEIISECRRLLPVKKGQQGLRQSDALFHHTKALPELCDLLFKNLNINRHNIAAVGVSARPRDVAGSYMPCFLAGVSFAAAFSAAANIPMFDFSHQCGHIAAAAFSGKCENVLNNEFISFHVSGGTTEVLSVSSLSNGLKCTIVGGTNDLNAGQAIDRCGVALGMDFPCGKAMDELSQKSSKSFVLKPSVKGGYCNLSGLENMCRKMIDSGENNADICRFTFSYIAQTLFDISQNIRRDFPKLPILYAGGVMSNTLIRNYLSEIDNIYFANREYSCDNAFGISVLASYKYKSECNEELI